MTISKVKAQLKKISKDFALKFDKEWFKHLWISNRLEILTEYLGTCPDPIYQKYGKNPNERIRNLDKFVDSRDFKECLKRYGGQVAHRSELKQEEKWIKQINNKKIRKELLEFHAKLKKSFGKAKFLALVTKPRNEKERKWQLSYCIREEWIHILLDINKIKFQDIKKKYWPYDEGIATYFAFYLENKLNRLEKFRDKEKYPMEKEYYIYAIKFRQLFKNKKSPEDRKKALIKLLNSLK